MCKNLNDIKSVITTKQNCKSGILIVIKTTFFKISKKIQSKIIYLRMETQQCPIWIPMEMMKKTKKMANQTPVTFLKKKKKKNLSMGFEKK